MARPWSLGHPHPDHDMRVIRHRTGRSSFGRSEQHYGTSVRCSCGDPFGWQRVSNRPPSRSQAAVNAHYNAHVTAALAAALWADPPVFGEPPCL